MNTRKIIDVIKQKCHEAPERAPDYHDAILDVVSDIVWAEYQHTIRQTTIQQKVTECCEVLGDYIQRNTRDER